jgi:predicted DNA-binding transcriptional regulator YafY
MRADRLVATLLLLQQRGQVTAAEVAAELEVSERTARRDLEALGVAGLPVYSMQGRNGGWRLAGGGKTDLSGLNAAEARALFLVAGPLAGATPDVKAALRKLVRALPEQMREGAQAAAAAMVVDPTGWDRQGAPRPTPPFLDAVQQAVVNGEQIVLGYVARDRSETSRVVHPLGIASKGPVWYLITMTDAGQRTFRIDRITSIESTGDAVERPANFDLTEAWKQIADQVDQLRTPVRARGVAQPAVLGVLRWRLQHRLSIGPAQRDGRVEIEVRSGSVEELVGELAGFGAGVEIVEPAEVIGRLRLTGAQLVELYGV